MELLRPLSAPYLETPGGDNPLSKENSNLPSETIPERHDDDDALVNSVHDLVGAVLDDDDESPDRASLFSSSERPPHTVSGI